MKASCSPRLLSQLPATLSQPPQLNRAKPPQHHTVSSHEGRSDGVHRRQRFGETSGLAQAMPHKDWSCHSRPAFRLSREVSIIREGQRVALCVVCPPRVFVFYADQARWNPKGLLGTAQLDPTQKRFTPTLPNTHLHPTSHHFAAICNTSGASLTANRNDLPPPTLNYQPKKWGGWPCHM